MRGLQNLCHTIQQYIRFYNKEHYQERLNGLSPLKLRVQAV
ncbi:IS3 family transposase [Exiguobacterium sp. s192]